MATSDSASLQIIGATFDWLPDNGVLPLAQVQEEAPCASAPAPRVSGRCETPVASQSSIVGESLQTSSTSLRLLRIEEWDDKADYTQQPLTCICFALEWIIKVNGKKVATETQQNLAVAPGDYYVHRLHTRISKEIQHRSSGDKQYEPSDCSITISVDKRGEDDFVRCCPGHDVPWLEAENQLRSWSKLFQIGKKLRVKLVFNFKLVGNPSASSSKGRGKRSATDRMLAEKEGQDNAEEADSGAPAAYKHVYDLLRCPAQHCTKGPYCFRDPSNGNRHIGVGRHFIRALQEHRRAGGSLQSHADIPQSMQQQLREHDRQTRPLKLPATGQAQMHYHIPGPPPMTHVSDPEAITATTTPFAEPLRFPDQHGEALKDYCEWHKRKEDRESGRQAYDLALKLSMDWITNLRHIHTAKNVDKFVNGKVPEAIAWLWVYEIPTYLRELELL